MKQEERKPHPVFKIGRFAWSAFLWLPTALAFLHWELHSLGYGR